MFTIANRETSSGVVMASFDPEFMLEPTQELSPSRYYRRAGRLHAIAADILQHLGQRELTISAVARRQQISDSYIRKLFQRHGTNYSEFVLNQRLARAHDLLLDPALAERTILSIAFEVGFGDLSYF